MDVLNGTIIIELAVGAGIVCGALAPILRSINRLRDENTRQHEEGRQERVRTEERLTSAINEVAATSKANGETIADVRERVATVEVNQQWLTQGVKNLPAFQNAD